MSHAHDARLKTQPKKTHPFHADDALVDGKIDLEKVGEAVAHWLTRFKNGESSVKLFTEYAIDENTDVLLLVRTVGKLAHAHVDVNALEAGSYHWLEQFANGTYTVLLFKEEAIDADEDLLTLVRRKTV